MDNGLSVRPASRGFDDVGQVYCLFKAILFQSLSRINFTCGLHLFIFMGYMLSM